MQVIKRDGSQVEFDRDKIRIAITKAFLEVDKNNSHQQLIENITNEIEYRAKNYPTWPEVEEIQNWVEDALMASNRKDVARAYIRFRQKREMIRENQKTYESILDLVELKNEELKDENSNKNAVVASTQRDYMAGEVSKDISKRILLPKAVVDAHNNGEIHFHDMDYFAQHIFNCCLVNLEDMLQNGTVINKTLIEKPHSFSTACNIATQVSAIVASGQYGGQTMTLSHLAPFVDMSRRKIRAEVEEEVDAMLETISDDWGFTYEKTVQELTEKRVKKEIERGVQIMQYQINTLNTSNG